MLKLETFKECSNFILNNARKLEQELYKHYFVCENSKNVLDELKQFQNDDGGFGKGLEPDALMPQSSPFQTAMGIRYLTEFDDNEIAKEMIKKAIKYLESTYIVRRNGWFSVSSEVNNYFHAPWWHYNESEKMTIIDRNWGNPTAEIIAYLYKYRNYVLNLDVDNLSEYAINYIENKTEFNSEFELFCFIKLYNVLPTNLKIRLEKGIKYGISKVIEYDKIKWNEYVPKPLDFIENKEMNYFGIYEGKINENLDFYIERLERDKKIIPYWGDTYYKGENLVSYNNWEGILTLNTLVIIDKFNKINT